MATIAAQGRVLPVLPGASLLEALNQARLPVGQSCRGEGVCRSCAVRVVFGAEALVPPTALERRAGRSLDLEGGWRLACQARPDPEAAEGAVIALWHPAWGRPAPTR